MDRGEVTPAARRADAARTLGLAVLGAALAWWSWGQWLDVQVDFGRELYAAWRLSEGDRLVADLAWLSGPLSAWWNAAWFRVLGGSLSTLVSVNLALCALTLALLVRSVGSWSTRTAGTAAGVVFLCVFAFSRTSSIGNYNFVTPYSHELVHGLVLALLALAALAKVGEGRLHWAALAGLAIGCLFLTKAEVFLAGAGAAATRLALHVATPGTRRRAATCGALAGAALVPPIAAFLALLPGSGVAAALRATAGAWVYVGNDAVRALPFYRSMSGLDAPARNLALAAAWAAGTAALFGALYLAARRLPARRGSTRAARGFAFVAGAALTLAATAPVRWIDAGRPLPLLVLVLSGVALARWWRSRNARTADRLAFLVLAGLLLAKVALYARVLHYGFVLGLPAALAVVATVTGDLPAALERRGRAGAFLRAGALGVVTVFCGAHLALAHRWYHGRPDAWDTAERVAVGHGADRFLAGGRGPVMRDALAEIEARVPPDGTLLVVPEGVMLNYLSRRRSPTRYVNFMPPELLLWSEDAIVAALERSPPDVVAIVHKDTSEYGVPRFGEHYGERLMAWIRERYRPSAQLGAVPLVSTRFGVAVLERRE